MSAPTKSEFDRLSNQLDTVNKFCAVHRVELDDLDSRSEILRVSQEKFKDEVAKISASIEVCKHLLKRLEKHVDESDRRRWSFVTLFVGCALTLLANLLLFTLKIKS